MFPNQKNLTHLLSSLLTYFPQAYHLVGKIFAQFSDLFTITN